MLWRSWTLGEYFHGQAYRHVCGSVSPPGYVNSAWADKTQEARLHFTLRCHQRMGWACENTAQEVGKPSLRWGPQPERETGRLRPKLGFPDSQVPWLSSDGKCQGGQKSILWETLAL